MYRFVWPLRFWWLMICCLHKEVYLQILDVCPSDYTAVAGSGKVGPVNQVNHTSWVAVVTSTDRPKSVRNRCVIKLFVALFVLSLCPFGISVGVGAFVIRLSQISSFFSFYEERCFKENSFCDFSNLKHVEETATWPIFFLNFHYKTFGRSVTVA